MRFNFLPSGLLDQAVDAVSFRQAAAALASPELAMLQRRRDALRAPVGISSPVPGVAPPAPDPGVPMDPATRMSWQRVDALQRWNAFDDDAMAQGNRQADWVLNQARVPHAGRLDPMQRPVGPGVVAPSMLPDQSGGPTYEELSQFLAQREGNFGQSPEFAQRHDDAIAEIEARRGGLNINDLRRQNFNTWRDRNATAVAQGKALREKKRTARQEYAQRQKEAANPAVARDRILARLNNAAPHAPGNFMAMATLMGPDAALGFMRAQADIAQGQRGMDPVLEARLAAANALSQSDDPRIRREAERELTDFMRGARNPFAAPGGPNALMPPTAGAPTAPPQFEIDQIERPWTSAASEALLESMGEGPFSMEPGWGGGEPSWKPRAAELLMRGADPVEVAQIILEQMTPRHLEAAKADEMLVSMLSGTPAADIVAKWRGAPQSMPGGSQYRRSRRGSSGIGG